MDKQYGKNNTNDSQLKVVKKVTVWHLGKFQTIQPTHLKGKAKTNCHLLDIGKLGVVLEIRKFVI